MSLLRCFFFVVTAPLCASATKHTSAYRADIRLIRSRSNVKLAQSGAVLKKVVLFFMNNYS